MSDARKHIEQEVPFLSEIKGFMDPEEGEALYEIALKTATFGPLLEVGSYCGLSTIYLGLAVKEKKSLLYAIDHHQGSEEHQPGEAYHDPELYDRQLGRMNSFLEFQNNIIRAGLHSWVVPIVCKSEVVSRFWSIPLSMVFIDGGHSMEAALTDYRSWAVHVRPGGILAIHDIFRDPSEGGQAPYEIYNLALSSGLFKELPQVRSLGLLQRVGR